MEIQNLKKALAEALAAMDELMTHTVDADLAYGIGLTEGEYDARAACLAVFEKYGPDYLRREEDT